MLTENSVADIVSSQGEGTRQSWDVPGFARGPGHSSNLEFELLCACCRQEDAVLDAVLARDLRWDRIFELANYHRVLPAMINRLQHRPGTPASIRTVLAARMEKHCCRVLRFSAELVRILDQFDADGIPVIAQKGPMLAHLLYGDAAMRDFGDLDLLVQPCDVQRATQALAVLGYDKRLKLSPRQENALLRSGYEHVFGCGVEKNLVELQWSLLPRFYSIDLDVRKLFERSVQRDFEGRWVRVLCHEDQMLYLCMHAAKHRWAQLGQIRDIGTLAQLDLDWDWLDREARRLGVRRICWLSLELAHRLMGVKSAGLDLFTQPRVSQKLVVSIESSLSHSRELPTESADYFAFMLRVRERWRDRAGFLWRLSTTPSVGEWQACRIPDAFSALYVGVRMARLGRRLAAFTLPS